MADQSRKTQAVWAAVLVVAVVGAGLLQSPIDARHREYELTPAGGAALRSNPEIAALTMMPGGLRAVAVNYLWIRAQTLMREGRHFDAYQLSSMICRLQPQFEGVWSFHSWNMAWNISVATHTPEERWMWVYNGIKLLRDEGIPLNRESLVLYKDLGWIYFFKIGGYLDEMESTYKKRWAYLMQRLLGAPPQGSTAPVLEWFRPIADAPLDKTLSRQGEQRIQQDLWRGLLAEDEKLAGYWRRLQSLGVAGPEDLLDVWAKYSNAAGAAVVRPVIGRPGEGVDPDSGLYKAINDREHTESRRKMLSFIRAQMLWNVYRMDPDWMMHLMETYGPLDWRLPWPHGLYWSTYGIEVAGDINLGDIESLNIDRIVMNSLKLLTWRGRLSYIANPEEPENPSLYFFADPRFVEPTHRAHLRFAEAMRNVEGDDAPRHEDLFKGGHVNYLVQAIQMLYAGHRYRTAQRYLDFLNDEYDMHGPKWDAPLDEFVVKQLYLGDRLTDEAVSSQITMALHSALVLRALGRMEAHNETVKYAQRLYARYRAQSPDDPRLHDFGQYYLTLLATMLVEPRTLGYNLHVRRRSVLYRSLPEQHRVMIYDRLGPALRRQAAAAGVDFDKAFPAPEGLEAYRKKQREALRAGQGDSAEQGGDEDGDAE